MEAVMAKPRGRTKGTKMSERPIVQISDKYRVIVDKLNLILQQYAPDLETNREEDKDSIDGWKFFGYFTTWDGVFWKLFRAEVIKQIGKKKQREIMELKKIFLDAKAEIKKMAEEIKN